MALIPGLEGINWTPFIGQIIYYIGWGLATIVVLGVMYYAYNLTTYTIKATVFPLYGSGKDGIFSVGKPKQNSLRWVDKKTAWQPLKPLFNKIKLQPFDSEFIYPEKKIFAFEYGTMWMPGKINTNDLVTTGIVNVNPVSSYLRNWEIITHKQIDMELASEDWWSKNKQLFIMMICGICCLIACLITIYFAYKFMGPNTTAMKGFTEAINNLVNVGGAAPK